MKKILLIIFCMLLFTVLSSNAATWVQISDYTYIDRDNITNYINDRGEVDYSKKVYWTKTFNKNQEEYKELNKIIKKIYKKSFEYSIEQKIIDINNKSIAFKSAILYDKDGNVIPLSNTYTERDSAMDWMSIVPNSVGEYEYNLVTHTNILSPVVGREVKSTIETDCEQTKELKNTITIYYHPEW